MQHNRSLVSATLAAACLGLGVMAWQQRRNDDLRGEVALFTGGSRGLGFLIARELGRQGFGLVTAYGLPQAPPLPTSTQQGMRVDAQLNPTQRRWRHLLMTLGQQAAQRYHQYSAYQHSE